MTNQELNALRPLVDVDAGGIRLTSTKATIMPARVPLLIVQGAALWRPIFWTLEGEGLVDLSTATAKMAVRTGFEVAPLLTLTDGAGITLTDGTDRNVPNLLIEIAAAVTAVLNFYTGVYDLEVTVDGKTERVLEGPATLRRRANS